MDIASQIVTAIVAGAAVAGKDVANNAIKDAYEALKDGIRALFKRPADTAVAEIEADPKSLEAREKLKEAIGLPAEADIKTLTEKIETLLKKIAADESSSSVVKDKTLNINLTEIEDLYIRGGIIVKGYDEGVLAIKRVKKARISGGVNLEAKAGN